MQVKQMGTSLLSPEDLTNLTETKQRMASIYNSARICPYEKKNCDLATEGWTLDPEIENRFAESTDYDELEWLWTQWHQASGAKMRNDYKIYVELMNRAAEANSKISTDQ
jgi:peptidyl-dipeptidase A